ncbi:MAG: ABC transporter ATP-binding protein [Burkholderiaceae bacterium]|nr:ABC transporter ATP-binding protein [Pseudomonadota bacterium]MCO5115480.1 ABC transporter ATP-binding protein [Burkholderiaceae bacterium]MCP5217961.1 ABC transporter ATP-binding protein [Burkholderiaceae bacterium]
MLKVRELTAGYGGSQVLFGMDFEVQAGQAISLIGRNGMGKTTTVRTLMGMLPARGGHVELQGKTLGALAPHAVARLGLGLVPEGRRVFGSLSVEENLLATARSAPGDKAWTLERVMTLFERLRERRRQSARTLSGGEQQMLAIGRALMTNPKLLVLDEATEGLAPLIRQEIWRCLRALKSEGLTIVVIDKNLGEMASLLDRHHIVEKGRVVWSGTPDELKARGDLAQRYLGL